jgi:alpha-ketoglutarate-dependent taurine dioxygenase
MTKFSSIAGIALLVLTPIACDTNVSNPGPVQDEFLNDRNAATAMVNGAGRALSAGMNWVGYTGAAIAREVHPAGSTGSFGISNRWQNGELGTDDSDLDTVLVNGKRLVKVSPWHFDHCYNNELNRAGVLRAVVIAPEGGRTGFVDGIELYRQLSPELRERIDGLNVIYTLDVRLSAMRFGRPRGLVVGPEGKAVMDNVREGLKFPRAMHPAVWTRATGEKVLHVGPWMSAGLEHHENPEGDALLEAVCQEINDKAHAYWHDWKPTDMVIWDNWRMLHAVEGCDPKYERRTQRTTIRGDYGLGYFEDGKKIGEVEREFMA